MHPESLRQEGYRRIRRSKQLKAQMSGISPSELSNRFGLHYPSVIALRDGKSVNARKVTEAEKQYIAECARRHLELSKDYESLDQIALSLGVSRRCVGKWSKQIGMSATRDRNIGSAVKDYIDQPNAAAVEFLTMRLSQSPSGVRGYY